MREPGEISSVVDAFDEDDPFDLHLTLGFSQTWKHANIRRETTLNQPGLSTGGFVSSTENIASYTQSVSTLNMGADIGLYKDLALLVRLPLVLNDSRSLGDLDGSASNPQRLTDSAGETLFSPRHKSPNRSGVDWLGLGLQYAIFNQQRDLSKPNWLVSFESRFGIGTALHACNDSPATGTARCADPQDPAKDRDPGISRRMNTFVFSTLLSRRRGYIEPFMGASFLVEFAQESSDFISTNPAGTDLQGIVLNHAPLLGTLTLGTEIIPWERREQFQRVAIDLKLDGTYHSPGRDYSELFDALGSSQARSLRQGNPAGYKGAGPDKSVVDPSKGNVYFTGITDTQAFGSVRGSASATWQAGEYIKFTAGLGLTYNQSHVVTGADSCNPNVGNASIDVAGPCRAANTSGQLGSAGATGVPNPNHRPVIDLPGHRFSVDDTTLVDLWVSGVVMF